MKVLVIGSGGREHALAKKFSQSPLVEQVYCAPGNAGMTKDNIQIIDISELNNEKLIEFAKKENISLSFVGPETALSNGIVDAFQAAGLKIFGPSKAAAQIESSKDFAKNLMKKYGVPTAQYATFTDLEKALAYVKAQGAPIVIKADGLAAGKGVTVALDEATANHALEEIFKTPHAKVVIEEYLEGEEFSLFSFVHQGKIYPMPLAQDHKRAFDGDKGPNTGGMGAYCPVAHLSQQVFDEAMEKVVRPTVAGLISEGLSFTGVLYAGLILTKDGVKTIEFNARFGDPETQVVLPRLKSDLLAALLKILAGEAPELRWEKEGVTLGVVVASKGYPGAVTKGIPLPEIPTDLEIFYAGVTEKNQVLVSNGGRVYLVAQSGKDVASAQHQLYEKLDALAQPDFFYRHDIGDKAN